MRADRFLDLIESVGAGFFAGVPDSLLRPFCDEIYRRYGSEPARHLVAQNEGGAAACAAGYYLATGRPACVYLQNSGIGNLVNPAASLAHPLVYGIPILYVVGWRGQPGTVDEPQHTFQGIITGALLETIDAAFFTVRPDTTEEALSGALSAFAERFQRGGSAALLVERGALAGETRGYANGFSISREAAIERIAEAVGDAVIVSSTGKISRELYEVRERLNQGHERDFLTVGSMGHDPMIALGIALQKPDRQVWCVQGDGAFLMQMGAAAIVGSAAPGNLRHVVLNNAAHESVGGMPTCGETIDIAGVASACGFKRSFRVSDEVSLADALAKMAAEGSAFLEVRCALGSRKDLGRPSGTPGENKLAFMRTLRLNEVKD